MIKKILFGMAALLTLTACNEDFTDWADPQHNDQPATVSFGNGSIAEVGLIDFANIADDQTTVQVCNITAPTASDAAYAPTYTIELDGQTYDIDANGNMSTTDLHDYIESVYGKAPYERAITAKVNMWVSDGTTTIKMATSSDFSIKAKLDAPHIADSFYIIGAPQGWSNSRDGATSVPFTHSTQSVYDDPTFTVTFPAGDGDCWFAILSSDDVDAFVGGDWNVLIGNTVGNGNTAMSGELTSRNAFGGENNFMMPAGTGAYYTMTINMMDYTYTIKAAASYETWYLVGGDIADGSWNNSVDGIGSGIIPLGVKSAEESNILQWTGYLAGNGFKLIKTPGNWDDQWGQGAGFGEFVKNDGGSGNINVPSAGYYTVTLNTASDQLTVEAYNGTPTNYDSMGIAGTINGWSFDATTPSCASNNHDWYYTFTSAGGDEVKFGANCDWGTNWGSDTFPYGIGVNNGANIPVTAGTWVACFNDITGAYTFIQK